MSAFDEYVDMYGLHFNKKLYEWAVSNMKDRNGNKVQPRTKEQVTEIIRTQGVAIKNDKGYDIPYVYSMLFADCWGSSYQNDKQLALGVMDFLDDPDGSKTKAFDHFIVDCRAKDEPIFWDEML